MVTAYGRWWNGQWGNWNRRWLWLEQLPDGRWQVRWRGGDWSDHDGSWRTRDSVRAVDVVCWLLEHEVVGEWREVRSPR